jgi:hypothetical protein
MDEHFQGYASGYIPQELVYVVLTCLLCWVMEFRAKAEARTFLEKRLLTQSEATVQELLSGLCDAVVRIRSDLAIFEPAPKLAHLLLRENRGSAFLGVQFCDFLAYADRDRFRDFLERVGSQLSPEVVAANIGTSVVHQCSIPRCHWYFF